VVATDVIVLNGGSSSGKTSIARSLQPRLAGTWLTLGVDDLIAALGAPTGDDAPIAFQPDGGVLVRPGFRPLETAWWAGLAAVASSGVGVIFEDVFLGGAASQAGLQAALGGLDVLWVGVRCPAEEAAEREASRPDRIRGMAASQAELAHLGVTYDLEVDTATSTAAACAEAIVALVVSGPRPGVRRPIVVDYDPTWPLRAAQIIESLHDALGPLARRIEHIGSTAIPGMAAKEIVDLQVSVDDLDAAATVFDTALPGLGFGRSAVRGDHVPEGSPRADPGQWAKWLWTRRQHSADDVNLHVRRIGSPNERLALLFRDWFRSHPEAVPAYAAFKRSLAGVTSDTGTYADVKDPVVDVVISVAEEWAETTRWQA
jgi:GrpB-like predicted nucleotidyltransferase (UPF0157 family)/chloramphenicol 3-O-phosphotransferase